MSKNSKELNINLITINTPVRDDYQLSDDAAARVNHVNIYDEEDPVQARGGNDPSQFVGDVKVKNALGSYTVEAGKKNGVVMTGEMGEAGRTFKNATNIKTTKNHCFSATSTILTTGWMNGRMSSC